MLKMKWMTDHDGRLVATWIQSDEPGSTGGREETIMIQMKWTMDLRGCLVTTPAQSAEPQSSKDSGLKSAPIGKVYAFLRWAPIKRHRPPESRTVGLRTEVDPARHTKILPPQGT